MMIVVRPRITSRSALRISCSLLGSTDDVASSRIRMRGSASTARGDRDALPLTTGERVAVLADDRVVARRAGPARTRRRPRAAPRARPAPSSPRDRRTRCCCARSRRRGTCPRRRGRPRAGPRSSRASRTSCPSMQDPARRRRRRTAGSGGRRCVFPEAVAPTSAMASPPRISRSRPSSTGRTRP